MSLAEVVAGLRAVLEQVARQRADLIRDGWSVEALGHNPFNAATGGIWRVQRDTGSAILKIATPNRRDDHPPHWATSTDPAHWNYWQREVLAYRTGLATEAYAVAGIRAPVLLDSVDRADGSVALWLADVPGRPGMGCSPEQLGEFGYRLGVAHSAWLGRETGAEWLSRDWLRAYTTSRPVPETVDWDHPVAVQTWPEDLRAGLRSLWERRYDVLAATDALPRTLGHHDVWPMNLIVDESGPVLLDWTFVGPGPIGEDAANLILDTFFDGLVDVDLLDDVADAVRAGYQRGLAPAVDAAEVRRAIMLGAAAKYFWLAPGMLAALHRHNPDRSQQYDSRDDLAMFDGRRRVLELLVDWFRLALE
ncbi:aminoglycoside phosphotransferase [Micromonospora sp. NBC_01699]|uniref:phosphotransferase n=1 Tax=Micromonospora sp. NBC_01699 TaxID=2975984 RepID=UPI002E3078B4|nr:phosphotransferase [Micromonospora sp. NBC_01699]